MRRRKHTNGRKPIALVTAEPSSTGRVEAHPAPPRLLALVDVAKEQEHFGLGGEGGVDGSDLSVIPRHVATGSLGRGWMDGKRRAVKVNGAIVSPDGEVLAPKDPRQ
ncbi:MAG: hypothetical protein HOW73_20480 [Polyangiaceae bacterium]|nr:hypothetical protein [Polyangiaceae bacterium]